MLRVDPDFPGFVKQQAAHHRMSASAYVETVVTERITSDRLGEGPSATTTAAGIGSPGGMDEQTRHAALALFQQADELAARAEQLRDIAKSLLPPPHPGGTA